MTYCVATKLKSGIMLASDSRTNSGIDHISSFCKMHHFSVPTKSEIFLLNSGNLATTQEVVSILRKEIDKNEEGHILALESLFDVSRKVGDTVRRVLKRLPESTPAVNFKCTFIVGGQIEGEEPRLFLVYPEGNFIEASEETPYFQIGESKYGKPVLDRAISYNSTPESAAKCILMSFDATMRSNVSVGLPINLAYVAGQSVSAPVLEPITYLIDENDKEFAMIRQAWEDGIRELFNAIPTPSWWEQKTQHLK